MESTFYRRPLPGGTIAFASDQGRAIFAEALAAGGLDGYFRLAEQFHTQSDPAFCGLGSLVVALNALAIDPGRLWKGPWRWFAEDLLDCCVPLEHVRANGLTLDQLGCLARCNGAEVAVQHSLAHPDDLGQFRRVLVGSARGDYVLIASYDRSLLGQTGSGHFSPIGGYHAARDLVLLLDVARFKYPPHWVAVEQLWRAMHPIDPATGLARGWLSLRARAHGLALGYTLRCTGETWEALAERLRAAFRALSRAEDAPALLAAMRPLAETIELRKPATTVHQQALARARDGLRALPLYALARAAVGSSADVDADARAEATALLLLASWDLLSATQREQLGAVALEQPLADELRNLAAQLSAVTGVG